MPTPHADARSRSPRRTHLGAPRALLLALAALLTPRCAPLEGEPGDDELLRASTADIIGGTEATQHPDACVISFNGSLCSGALIAPNVVLTAGHCVHGATSWRVTCPYSSDTATVTASQGAVAPNYPNLDDPDREWIDNNRGSDVGLIRLDRPLRETRVARVRLGGVRVGLRVQAIGRINNGRTTSRMFASPAFALTHVDARNGYWAGVDRTVIESGDSGGPLKDTATGEIVAVNSAGIEASACRRGAPCDEWAILGAAATWFNATFARFADGGGTTTPPTPTPTGCAAAATCGACTALPTCGWCAGRCVEGTSSGGASCTASAGNWAWTSGQCGATTTPPPPPADPCATSTTCGACTLRASCGWCSGQCRTGTSTGPSGGASCAGTPWAWYSSQCR